MVWWRGLLATVIAAENGQFAHIERPALPFRLLDGIVHELIASPGLFPLFLLPVVFAFVEDFFGLLAELVFLARFSHLAVQ